MPPIQRRGEMQPDKRSRPAHVTVAYLACAVLFALGAARAAHAESDPVSQTSPTADGLDALLARPDLDPTVRMEIELFKAINQKRAEAGLSPLQLDGRLVAAAREHSKDMAAARRCRHAGRDGSTSRVRIRRQGYPHNNWAGENIICSRRTVEAALTWWMRSAPHRRNILHRHFTHIGVGVDPSGPYGPMWTLNFAAGAADTVPPVLWAGAPPAAAVAAAPPSA
ncbi:MAG: CAP domain-containing protein, partial [Chloroflexi bacterium CFX6]|nr:CAP domain-containing protein [Chloroflexi bacterium CFX6]